MRRTAGIVGGVISGMILAGSAHAANISYVGTEIDNQDPKIVNAVTQTGATSGWRFPSTAKHFLVASNTIYGTDGYDLFQTTALARPTYVSAITQLSPASFGPSTGYEQINDPTTNSAGSQSGNEIMTGTWYENGAAVGSTQNMFSFTLTGSVPHDVRVGVLYDNTDGAQTNISIDLAGGASDSGLQATTAGNQRPDWYFFDILNGASGDVYTLSMKNTGAGTPAFQVGGIAFDSTSTPEPASLSLLGLGSLALLARRRNSAIPASH